MSPALPALTLASVLAILVPTRARADGPGDATAAAPRVEDVAEPLPPQALVPPRTKPARPDLALHPLEALLLAPGAVVLAGSYGFASALTGAALMGTMLSFQPSIFLLSLPLFIPVAGPFISGWLIWELYLARAGDLPARLYSLGRVQLLGAGLLATGGLLVYAGRAVRGAPSVALVPGAAGTPLGLTLQGRW